MLTRRGWAVVAVGVVLAAAGWWAGWQELAIAGCACGGAVLAAFVASLGPIRYHADVDLPRTRVGVGDLLVMTVRVTNQSHWRALPATLAIGVGSDTQRLLLPALRPGRSHAELVDIPTGRRAVLDVGPARVVRADPWGLAARDQRVSDQRQVIIHPAVRAMPGLGPGLIRDVDGATTPALAESSVAFHALRPYVRGDDRRHIHWRTSARTGTLMVRQWEDTRRTCALIALDTSAASYPTDDDFELAVSACASLAVQCRKEGCDAAVSVGEQIPVGGSAVRMLDLLAGAQLDGAQGGSPGCPAASGAVRRAPASGTCAVVTGPAVPLGAVQGAFATLGVGTAALVIRCQAGTGAQPRLARLGRVVCVDACDLEGLAMALAAVVR